MVLRGRDQRGAVGGLDLGLVLLLLLWMVGLEAPPVPTRWVRVGTTPYIRPQLLGSRRSTMMDEYTPSHGSE